MAAPRFRVPFVAANEIGSENARKPETVEELEMVQNLDKEAFEKLKRDVLRVVPRTVDPAYAPWAVRRSFFWSWHGRDALYPEPRPALGSPVTWYHDVDRPWAFPGMDESSRRRYPIGWDQYLARESTFRGPLRRDTGAASASVAHHEEESVEVKAARLRLERLREAQKVRAYEEEAEQLEIAMAAADAAKMARKAAANPVEETEKTAAPTASRVQGGSGLQSSQWSYVAKGGKPSADGGFPPLEKKTAPVANEVPEVAPLASDQAWSVSQKQRQKKTFGGESRQAVKSGGTRDAMGRTVARHIVVTLRKEWLEHFKPHKEIAKTILRETKCDLVINTDYKAPLFEVFVGKSGSPPYRQVEKAHDMMLCYCEEWISNVKNPQRECYWCHKFGHVAKDCPSQKEVECSSCGERGHPHFKCPKPPTLGRCHDCGRAGHKAGSRQCAGKPVPQTKGKQDPDEGDESGPPSRDPAAWKQAFHQGEDKRANEVRVKIIDDIMTLNVRLDLKSPREAQAECKKLSTSDLTMLRTKLQNDYYEKFGKPKHDMVFNETTKLRVDGKVVSTETTVNRNDEDGKVELVERPKHTFGIPPGQVDNGLYHVVEPLNISSAFSAPMGMMFGQTSLLPGGGNLSAFDPSSRLPEGLGEGQGSRFTVLSDDLEDEEGPDDAIEKHQEAPDAADDESSGGEDAADAEDDAEPSTGGKRSWSEEVEAEAAKARKAKGKGKKKK